MTNTYKNIAVFFGLVVLVLAFALWVMSSTQNVQGSAPQGMRTIVASSTVKVTVGSTSPITIFALNGGCTSRVITTRSASINFTIASSTDLDQTVFPEELFGHFQAASTTVVYDAGTFGCDVWQAVGAEINVRTPSSTISVTEFEGFR